MVPGQEPILPRSQRTTAHWFNTAAFTTTPGGQWGNASRSPIRLPGYNNVDASATKNFRFRESANVQLRVECFNFFNHVNWGAPGTNRNTPNTFGVITTSSLGAGWTNEKRVLQFGLKLQF